MTEKCEGKSAYSTMNEALRVAKAMNQRKYRRGSNHSHAPARVYKCEDCGLYHISGQRRRGVTR